MYDRSVTEIKYTSYSTQKSSLTPPNLAKNRSKISMVIGPWGRMATFAYS